MEDALRAIGDPTRRAILRLIRDEELPAGVIAGNFRSTRPAISQHLRILKDAGLIDERRDGTRRLYRARPEGLEDLRAFLDEMWDVSLARLKSAAENEARTQAQGEDG